MQSLLLYLHVATLHTCLFMHIYVTYLIPSDLYIQVKFVQAKCSLRDMLCVSMLSFSLFKLFFTLTASMLNYLKFELGFSGEQIMLWTVLTCCDVVLEWLSCRRSIDEKSRGDLFVKK